MARGGFPGGFGGGNMNNLMKQAQKLQKEMEEMQKNLENSEYEASVGGGAVVVKVSGKKEITLIKIKEEVYKKMNNALRNEEEKLNENINKRKICLKNNA